MSCADKSHDRLDILPLSSYVNHLEASTALQRLIPIKASLPSCNLHILWPRRVYSLVLPGSYLPALMFSESSGLFSQLGLANRASVAKDRIWFSDDYIPFSSFITDIFGNEIEVIGVGSVDLPTKTLPKKTGPSSHGVIHLKHVLHVPTIICNIVGRNLGNEYDERWPRGKVPWKFPGLVSYIFDRYNDCVEAYTQSLSEGTSHREIRISGPPVGPRVGHSPFDPMPKKLYAICAYWRYDEEQRLADLLASNQTKLIRSIPLTPAEMVWLKKHFESEYHFLRMHGLSIYNENERGKGRSILRILMYD